MKPTNKTKHLILFSILFLFRLYAEAQTSVWNQTYAISGSSLYSPRSLTNANGIFTASFELVTGNSINKLRITKHDYSGFLIGSNAFQFGSTIRNIQINKILSDATGNIYILITTTNFGSSKGDCYLFSYSSSLTLRWFRSLNMGTQNAGYDFTLATNGNIYASMTYYSGTATYLGVKKVNMNNGTVVYSSSTGTLNTPRFNTIISDASGNAYVCGEMQNASGIYEGYAKRITNAGIFSWTYIYPATNFSTFNDLCLDNFGNALYLCGSYFSNTTEKAIVIKLNTSGAVTGNYTLSNTDHNKFLRITYNVSGTISVFGNSETTTSNPTASLLVTTLNSTLSSVINASSYPTSIFSRSGVLSQGLSVIQHPNGTQTIGLALTAILGGGAHFYTYLTRINASGGVVFSNLIGNNRFIHPVVSTTISNTDFITSNTTSFNLTRYIAPPARLEEDVINNEINIQAIPNPTSSHFQIDGIAASVNVHIYDMSGRMVFNTHYQSGEPIDVTGWNKGLYLLKIETAEGIMSRKVMVE